MKQLECRPADDWRERFARDGFLSPIRDTAIPASGVDTHGHFGKDTPAAGDLEPAAVARQRELDRQVRATMGLAGP